MQYNTDGTYKNYGFRDGSPFNPMPYVQGTERAGLTNQDMKQKLLAEMVVMDRFGLSAQEAANWLDTGDTEVGWDFSQVRRMEESMGMTDVLFDLEDDPDVWKEWGKEMLDELLGYGEGA